MREAAARQVYEEAGRIKQRLEKLREIEHKAFAQVGAIQRFNWLIVQRGGGHTRVKPFFVRSGVIAPGEATTLKQLDAAAERWIREMEAPAQSQALPDRQMRSEQIWLLSHFLGKKDPPGLFLPADRLPAPADLSQTIRACFRKPEPPPDTDTDAPPEPGLLSPPC